MSWTYEDTHSLALSVTQMPLRRHACQLLHAAREPACTIHARELREAESCKRARVWRAGSWQAYLRNPQRRWCLNLTNAEERCGELLRVQNLITSTSMRAEDCFCWIKCVCAVLMKPPEFCPVVRLQVCTGPQNTHHTIKRAVFPTQSTKETNLRWQQCGRIHPDQINH